MLPKIETPTYSLEIPSTKKKVKYRPFLVKEEKLLLTVMEEEDEKFEAAMKDATLRIIDVCTFGSVKVEELTNFDIDYMFLNIRTKSRGDVVTPSYSCVNVVDEEVCGESNSVEIDLSKIKVEFPKEDLSKIMLNDEVGIQFKYISSVVFNKHQKETDSIKKMFKIIIDSIDYIFDSTEIYKANETPKTELVDFIENLTEKNFSKVQKFFSQQPRLRHTAKYECSKCGYKEDINYEGLDSFFDLA